MDAYRETLGRLRLHAQAARMVFCGLSICIDATGSLRDTVERLLAGSDPEAHAFAQALSARALAGVGGEMRCAWQDGPDWLDRHVSFRHAMGGTGPHAALLMTMLGIPALLAIATRSPEQMAVLDANLPLAQGGRIVRATEVPSSSPNVPKIYIFEFGAGEMLSGRPLPRSSRIIVRFSDPGIEDDRDFAGLTRVLAPGAGAAILSGFNAAGASDLGPPLARTHALITGWRDAGAPLIHLEMAGYDLPEYRDRVLRSLAGSISSLGMSQSEFDGIVSPAAGTLGQRMIALAERMGVHRLCVHADGWAATATTGTAATEREALLLGCLLASSRAARGMPGIPDRLPEGAVYDDPPNLPERLGRWNIVAVAAPYLRHPRTTLGLGDTFMAGCLIVLSRQPASAAEMPWTVRHPESTSKTPLNASQSIRSSHVS